MLILLVLLVCGVAYWNGANDNSKGVASLLGSRTLRYEAAMGWATFTTFCGSLAAVVLAGELLQRFSGRGLVPDALAGSEVYLASVAFGTGATVLLATRLGLPISTTHALIGAMTGAGWAAVGAAVNAVALGSVFLLPLLLSPLVAGALGAVTYSLGHRSRIALRLSKTTCVCVGRESVVRPALAPNGAALAAPREVATISVAGADVCEERYSGGAFGLEIQRIVDGAHVLSAGLVGFARGLNDAPKFAALMLVVPSASRAWSVAAVAIVMALGGLLHSRRVATTMSDRITTMNHGQGFASNLATGLLVVAASLGGLPVSTTHVAVGALVGIGVVSGGANYSVVRNVVLSWVMTLPCGAILGSVCYWLLK